METSVAPAAITSGVLDNLLHQPRKTLVEQYLYQAPLREWLQTALPTNRPSGTDLMQFCQLLAQTLGAWPQNTPGAPADAEQGGRAIFWFTKLALESRISSSSDSTAPTPTPVHNQPTESPQRRGDGLVVWVNEEPLSPEALELVTVIAPLVAQVLYQSSWEAAKQGKPLFAARLKAGEPESVVEIHRQLERRARDIYHPNFTDAVFEAWEKLHFQLEHLILPAEISSLLLVGDRSTLAAQGLFEDMGYIGSRSGYQFLGSLTLYATSFIRANMTPPRVGEPGGEAEASETTLNFPVENWAVLQVLELIVQAATDTLTPPVTGGLHSQDAQLLVQGAFGNNSGRTLINVLVQQGEPVARESIRLWRANSLLAEEEQSVIPLPTRVQRVELNAALARLLLHPEVQRSPEMRRAVGYLFELPVLGSPSEEARFPRLGTLERLAAWASREHLGGEALRALDALEQVPQTQRQALCVRLLAREPFVLTLRLLQEGGWVCPPWLSNPLSGAAEDDGEEEETVWLNDEYQPGSALEAGSPQIFLHARRHWHSQLSGGASASRAYALTVEWLVLSQRSLAKQKEGTYP